MSCVKYWLDIIESVLTSAGIIAAGLWAFYLYRRNRENHPYIEFTADILFHSKIGDYWVVELLAYVENKGKVRHELYNLEFDLYYIAKNDQIKIAEQFGNQVLFPHYLHNGSFLPSQFRYFFIEPNVKARYSYITRVPVNAELLIFHSWFKYPSKKESHTAEKTVKVPNNQNEQIPTNSK